MLDFAFGDDSVDNQINPSSFHKVYNWSQRHWEMYELCNLQQHAISFQQKAQ